MSTKSPISIQNPNKSFIPIIILTVILSLITPTIHSRTILSKLSHHISNHTSSITYLWPLPSEFTSGNQTLTVNPNLSLSVFGNGSNSVILKDAFDRYRNIIFKHHVGDKKLAGYDVSKLSVIINSNNEEPIKNLQNGDVAAYMDAMYNWVHTIAKYRDMLQLGVDESYTLLVMKSNGLSIIGEVNIEANTVYGALRGLETFSQLCGFDYGTKTVQIYKAPWFIKDKPRFEFRGLLLDTSRHYYPVEIIKQIIDSMSYAKLNVLHWHIIDEQSFPLEVPAYPNLWKGAYTKYERYTVEDASEIVSYAKMRGINVMAEIDVPGHAESWGTGYPDLWPSASCREPLDVSKNFTFEVLSGILEDMREIFPFELFHLGGDEVNTDCWSSTPHVKQWLQEMNMTTKDAYQYFVLKAQEMAISKNRTPVNWEETFNTFGGKLNPKTVVHNWLGSGVCPKVVAQGLKCIYSNQGFWYLDHLDVTWDGFYNAEPLEGITDASEQKLVLGGEVCMWSETADPSNVQATIWPRAAAAAERLWTSQEAAPTGNENALTRLQYFRCLLTRRGVQASPVTNHYARSAPYGPGSCYDQ